jgi:anti-sigma B factor antagonist
MPTLPRVPKEFELRNSAQNNSLQIEARYEDPLLVLELSGGLDIASADQLDGLITDVLGSSEQRVRVDLAGVTSIDSWGLGILLRAKSLSRDFGNRLEMGGAEGHVLRLMRLTGVAPLADRMV